MSLPPSHAETPLNAPDVESRDHELMHRIRAGEVAAFDELLSLYWAPVVAYTARMLTNVDSAEDVAQEVFIQLWQRHAAWVERGSVRAYLYRAARNLALNEKRQWSVRARWAERVRTNPAATRGPVTPDEEFDGRVLQDAVDGALAALPERRREVFVLVRYHGLTYRQAAEVMGISPQTVANQMTAALGELRSALEPYLAEPVRRPLRLL